MRFWGISIVLLWCSLCVSWGQSQQQKVDSLLILLKDYEHDDAHRVDLLNQLGYEYWIVAPVQSELYGNRALELAKLIDYPNGVAFAQRVIGVSHWARGNYDKAITPLLEAYKGYQVLQDTLGLANSLMNIGLVYSDQRNFTDAFTYFFQSIELFEQLGEEGRIATTYNKIGSIYTEQGQFDKGKEYFEKALVIHRNQNFIYGVGESYNRLGLLYRDQGDLEKGLSFLNQSLTISQSISDLEGMTKNFENLASIYIRLNQFERANQYLNQGLALASEIGSKKWLKDIYFDLNQVAYNKGDLESALGFYQQYAALKDSLLNEEKLAQMADLQAQLELAQQEKTIALKKQEIDLLQQQARFDDLMRNILIAGLIFLVILGYLVVNQLQLRIKNSKLRERELQRELDFKSRELTTYTLNFIQKNEIMEELKGSIDQLQKSSDPHLSKKLGGLHRLVDHSFNLDKDWQEFKLYFEQVHPHFFAQMSRRFPGLTSSEMRLCALVKLNLSMKESSTILGISPDSVKTARYRLRKKLNLANELNLSDFIRDIDQSEVLD